MTVSYPKPCYNEADYKEAALYKIGILKDTKSIRHEQFCPIVITY